MSKIADTALRDDLDDVLRRVQAGEVITVTTGELPVAELTPVAERQWVSGQRLRRVWATPAPKSLDADLSALNG